MVDGALPPGGRLQYLGLPQAAPQAVAGVLLVLQPLQVSLQTLLGHPHGLQEVRGLGTGLQRLMHNTSVTPQLLLRSSSALRPELRQREEQRGDR